VSNVFFFDSSTLIKLYHQEVGTERVEEIFRSPGVTLIISELATVEVRSAVARYVRSGEIAAEAADKALRSFEDDCAQRFVLQPLAGAVVEGAKDLLDKHGRQSALRSLDALQLASGFAVEPRGRVVFVCADRHLCTIAKSEGLVVLNPEAPESFSGAGEDS
jgi:predicted nucleic acid-binding protein